MRPTKSEANNGFTIIEVLIVLAIAGVIMLIIFMAIPVLQRNNRNSLRKQDVASILEVVSHYELANSGALPDMSSPSIVTQVSKQFKLHYYETTTVAAPPVGGPGVYMDFGSAAGADPVTNDLNTVIVANYRLCDADNPGDTLKNGAGFNDIVAVYAVETNKGLANRVCQSI
jgi:prepilin-type N-terminal cleavage/methylation domain-containing protein